MADRKDIDFSYTLTDKVIRLSLGDMADFSGAKYDGDFTLTLEQAQHRKHEYVAEQLELEPGQRVLDLGCGWGALLNHFRKIGSQGVGVTLSSAQLEACRRHGFDVRLHDARAVDPRDIRPVRRRRQPRRVRALLLPGGLRGRPAGPGLPAAVRARRRATARQGRFYLQTMVFGKNMIPVEKVSRDAPRDSDAWYLAMMQAAFPGSFLPFGKEQVVRCAEPHFRLVSAVSGRLDYIETIRQWDMRTGLGIRRMALLKLRRSHGGCDSNSASRSPRARAPTVLLRARADGPLPARVREAVAG